MVILKGVTSHQIQFISAFNCLIYSENITTDVLFTPSTNMLLLLLHIIPKQIKN